MARPIQNTNQHALEVAQRAIEQLGTAEVAKLAGVSVFTAGRWKRGEVNPSTEAATTLRDGLREKGWEIIELYEALCCCT